MEFQPYPGTFHSGCAVSISACRAPQTSPASHHHGYQEWAKKHDGEGRHAHSHCWQTGGRCESKSLFLQTAGEARAASGSLGERWTFCHCNLGQQYAASCCGLSGKMAAFAWQSSTTMTGCRRKDLWFQVFVLLHTLAALFTVNILHPLNSGRSIHKVKHVQLPGSAMANDA